MLRTIMKKEVLEQFSSLRFASILGFCTVLIILSLYTGASDYNLEQREYDTTRALARTELEQLRSYSEIHGTGVKVPKKPSPLSLICAGFQGTFGKFATVDATQMVEPALGPSKFTENPIFTVAGELDLTFIVKVVLTLLTIMLTYDAICGEREQGTLKQILANPVSRVHLILAKMISLFFCLLVAFTVPTLVGLVIARMVLGVHFTGGEWARMILIFGVQCLYLLLMFALGMFLSSRTQRSSTSLLLLLLCWVLLVNVIPGTAVLVARQLRPVPAQSVIQSQKEANVRAHTSGFLAQMQEFRKNRNLDNMEDRGRFDKEVASLFEEMERAIEQSNTELMEDYNRRKTSMVRLAMDLSRVSPTSALSYATAELAGTGLKSQDHFTSDLKAYSKALARYAKEKGASQMQMARDMLTGEGQTPSLDLSDFPVFREHSDRLSEVIAQILPDMVLLASEAMILLVLAFLSFVRYDVR